MGRICAQLVFTVSNLDTGAVASAVLVPGAVDPEPADEGRYRLNLDAVVDELAGRVGGRYVFQHNRSSPLDRYGRYLYLPTGWRPDLPAGQRAELEAIAIATIIGRRWQLYWTTDRPPERPDPDDLLDRWCRLADLLCLDLVVERHLSLSRGGTDDPGSWEWFFRLAVPGTTSLSNEPGCCWDSLREAITSRRPTEEELLRGLYGKAAPARWIDPPARPPEPPAEPALTVDQLDSAIRERCQDAPGAAAVHREGRWHFTALIALGEREQLTEGMTGQLHSHRVVEYIRAEEPPTPGYDAGPVPEHPCPDCADGTNWQRCSCATGAGGPDPDCRRCHGTGVWVLRTCFSCGDIGAVREGLVVTLTDLHGLTQHANWRMPDEPRIEPMGSWADGTPAVRLPEPYRVRDWALRLQVDESRLAEVGYGVAFARGLLDGTIGCGGSPRQAYAQHLAGLARGRPGGRLFVLVNPPPEEPIDRLAALVKLVTGLGLQLDLTVRNCLYAPGSPVERSGIAWQIDVNPVDTPVTRLPWPYGRTLADAVTRAEERRTLWIYRTGGAESIRVYDAPQQPDPPDPGLGGVELGLLQVAETYGGPSHESTAMARFSRGNCALHVGDMDRADLLASAATFDRALARLRLMPPAAD